MEEKNKMQVLMCTFVDKFFFEIEAHVTLSPSTFSSYVYDAIYRLFMNDPIQSLAFLNKYLASPESLFNLLLKCTEQQIRICFRNALFGSYNGVKDQKIQEAFYNLLIGFIGYELASQWTRFIAYFELLNDIIRHHEILR